jgi:hypothetical protein
MLMPNSAMHSPKRFDELKIRWPLGDVDGASLHTVNPRGSAGDAKQKQAAE